MEEDDENSSSSRVCTLDRLQALLRLERVYYELPSMGQAAAPAAIPTTTTSTPGLRRGTSGSLTALPESRRKIASWAYDVVDHFRFPREAVAWMMYYMDRMLLQHPPEQGPADKEFLLLSVASFYLAIKLVCKPSNRLFPVRIMVDIAKHQFTAQQIADTEYAILQGVDWHVHPPTADQFLVVLVQLCGPSFFLCREKLQDYATYLLELSVLYHCFLPYKPSEVAVAALHAASDLMVLDHPWMGSASGIADGHAVLTSDPAHVGSMVLDASRVTACRWHFAQVIQQQAPHLSGDHGTSASHSKHHSDDDPQLRTSSPVSVHPHATVELPLDAQALLRCDDSTLHGSHGPL